MAARRGRVAARRAAAAGQRRVAPERVDLRLARGQPPPQRLHVLGRLPDWLLPAARPLSPTSSLPQGAYVSSSLTPCQPRTADSALTMASWQQSACGSPPASRMGTCSGAPVRSQSPACGRSSRRSLLGHALAGGHSQGRCCMSRTLMLRAHGLCASLRRREAAAAPARRPWARGGCG